MIHDFAELPCLAFRHPLVGAPGVGFHGGPAITDYRFQALRHNRYGQPVDRFDGHDTITERLPGRYAYAGPAYGHFGHVMSETIHRLLPSRAAAENRTWLMATTLADRIFTAPDKLPSFTREILRFFDIDPANVTILARDVVVERLLIASQGSDFGAGPSPDYLEALRAHAAPRLAPAADNAAGRIYVSRSALPGGGLLGETYVEDCLAAAGFTILRPETMTLMAQMQAYAHAKILIFPEGSACHGVELLGAAMLDTVILLARREDHMEIFRRVLQPRALDYVAIPPPPGTLSVFHALKHITTGPLAHEALFDELRRRGAIGKLRFDPDQYRQQCRADFEAQMRHHQAEHPGAVDPALVSRRAERSLRSNRGSAPSPAKGRALRTLQSSNGSTVRRRPIMKASAACWIGSVSASDTPRAISDTKCR